jgi:D-alanyl-D-alanine carboxypeptidase
LTPLREVRVDSLSARQAHLHTPTGVAILLWATVLVSRPISGQGVQAPPGSVQSQEIARLLEKQTDDNHLAGMAAIVIRAESMAGIAAAGVRRQGENAPISTGDLFHLGSNTKAVTATMIARLVEAEKLSWTTTPLDAFPELRDTIHPAFKQITIEQLLSHHAGIPPYTAISAFKVLPKISRSATEQRTMFTAWVLQHAPAVPPGTKGLYSNAGYVIAAAMAERVTGSTWEALVTKLVLDPLGMHATYGWPLTADRHEPWGHVETKKGLQAIDQSDEGSRLPFYLLPAGGMFMSLGDYGKFLQMNLSILQGKKDKFLTVGTVKRLHSSTMHDRYALGWGASQIDGVPSSTHAGTAGSFYAIVALQASRDIGVAVVANSGGDRSASACEAVMNSLLVMYHQALGNGSLAGRSR